MLIFFFVTADEGSGSVGGPWRQALVCLCSQHTPRDQRALSVW